MRGIISKSWCKKLAGPEGRRDLRGGQGVRREAESERHEGDRQGRKERARRTEEQSQAGGKFHERKRIDSNERTPERVL
jgi:hypothetical protein